MEHVRAIARALGCEPAKIHADVPKLRTAFPQGGLSTGIAYAFQAHRDTWYAAPKAQINWWMPVWPVAENNIMEFDPHGFGAQVENNSGDYDYYVANAWRGEHQGLQRRQGRPGAPGAGARDPGRRDALTVVPPLGGIMLFSGDQLHATIPNTSGITRYSIDFRTVHVDDVHAASAPRWRTSPAPARRMRDFKRMTDGATSPRTRSRPTTARAPPAPRASRSCPTPLERATRSARARRHVQQRESARPAARGASFGLPNSHSAIRTCDCGATGGARTGGGGTGGSRSGGVGRGAGRERLQRQVDRALQLRVAARRPVLRA